MDTAKINYTELAETILIVHNRNMFFLLRLALAEINLLCGKLSAYNESAGRLLSLFT